MNYATLRQQINQRLYNRTDLDQVIDQFAQQVIQSYQDTFFYSSEIQDTSITTTPGIYLYNLPSDIRTIERARILLNQNPSPPAPTTLTSIVTLPASTLPVVSTTGYAASGGLFVGPTILIYGGLTPTSFTGVQVQQGLGGTFYPSGSGPTLALASGTAVAPAAGVWVNLEKITYQTILYLDSLQPPVTTIPSRWAPFNNQFRLYPAPGAKFPVELTGNGAPAAPVNDNDDNFWTEDAALLIIAATTAEVMETYIGGDAVQDAQPHRAREKREYQRLLKISLNMGGPRRLRPWGWGYPKALES